VGTTMLHVWRAERALHAAQPTAVCVCVLYMALSGAV